MRTTSNLARRVIRFFLVTTWALLLPTQLMAAEALEIGTRKQLFLDDHIIESLTPGIFAVLNQPLKYSGNPLIGTVKLTDLVPNQRLGKSLSC